MPDGKETEDVGRGIPEINQRFSPDRLLIKISGSVLIVLVVLLIMFKNSLGTEKLAEAVKHKLQPYTTGYQAYPDSNDSVDPLYVSSATFGPSEPSEEGSEADSQANTDIKPLPKPKRNDASVDPAEQQGGGGGGGNGGGSISKETLARWAAPPVVGETKTGTNPGQRAPRSEASEYLASLDNMQAQMSAAAGGGVGAPDMSAMLGLLGQSPEETNKAFAKAANDSIVEIAMALPTGSTKYKILQGKVIRATLESAINTNLPGKIRAIVSRDVYGESDRIILIPKGSRLIGEYNNDVQRGQTRIFVMWTRLIRPDNIDIALGSAAIDNLGRSGLEGEIETHFLKRFGSAALLSFIGVGVSANSRNAALSPGAEYQTQLANSFQNSAARDLASSSRIPDTHTTDQGATIQIFVYKDLDFELALKNPLPR